jgi:hypothetical protein
MQSIFEFLLSSPGPGKIYPMDEIEDSATEYATRASKSYKRLRDIIFRHEEIIRKRYRQSYATEAERRELLSSVWPNMPNKHLPASFDEVTGSFVPTLARQSACVSFAERSCSPVTLSSYVLARAS